MFSLHMPTTSLTHENTANHLGLENTLRKLSPILSQTATDTAGAFFSTLSIPSADTFPPNFNSNESILCSQKNMGEKFEMICNLAVSAIEWDRLFAPGDSDRYKIDAFCEMANCICGSVIAEADFSDAFGFLIPCVPWAIPADVSTQSASMRGAFRLNGLTVYYAFTIQSSSACLLAAA